jgi:hypothetical protein
VKAKQIGLLVGFGFGLCVWLLSRPLTGRLEPWDAGGLYYPGLLFLGGFAGGWIAPTALAATPIGAFVGQFLVFGGRILLRPGDAGLWPIGLVVLMVSSLLPLVGAMAGKAVRRFTDQD